MIHLENHFFILKSVVLNKSGCFGGFERPSRTFFSEKLVFSLHLDSLNIKASF